MLQWRDSEGAPFWPGHWAKEGASGAAADTSLCLVEAEVQGDIQSSPHPCPSPSSPDTKSVPTIQPRVSMSLLGTGAEGCV